MWPVEPVPGLIHGDHLVPYGHMLHMLPNIELMSATSDEEWQHQPPPPDPDAWMNRPYWEDNPRYRPPWEPYKDPKVTKAENKRMNKRQQEKKKHNPKQRNKSKGPSPAFWRVKNWFHNYNGVHGLLAIGSFDVGSIHIDDACGLDPIHPVYCASFNNPVFGVL